MEITLSLTRREAEAVLRAELSTGYGVRKSVALRSAEFKLREALITAEALADATGQSNASE